MNTEIKIDEELKKVEDDVEEDVEEDEDDIEDADVDDDADDDEDDADDDDIDEDIVNEDDTLDDEQAEMKNYIRDTIVDEDEDEDEDDVNDDYLKKFNSNVKKNHLEENHPEVYSQNFDNVKILTNIVKDDDNIVIDSLHKTLPFLTKYEKTRILGLRAKQIDSGATPFVKVESGIIDGYLIAMKELEEKKIPFIIKRPIPNGDFEYWNVSDLELIY